MITTACARKNETSPDSGENPFYLLCNGQPLPLAVQAEVPEALAFRDAWEAQASNEQKAYCCFHPLRRNWVGGAEDGEQAVRAAQEAWA